jgi:Mrp family chromosome partitioning ATPase/predicted Fe-Mo cluster-binding NifX family protein
MQKQDQEISQRLKTIKNTILVMSGKGGVGKSSVAAYLSVSLAKRGYKVGLMDVDLHGPSIPRILGLKGDIQPSSVKGKAHPVKYLPNMEVISIETLMGENKDVATIWRGPLKIGVIKQFIADIEWMQLDYLIIDSPPGTGDEPLTVAQTIPDAKALIVTTPQEVSLADVRKSINFCRQVNMEILGLVENMSNLICPHCGKEIDLFKANGGMVTAKKENLRLLGTLPLDPEVVRDADSGIVDFLENRELPFTVPFTKIVDEIVKTAQQGGNEKAEDSAQNQIPGKMTEGKPSKTLVIPMSGGNVAPHFGHCEEFAFIQTENGMITDQEMKTPPAHEPGVLPRWLYEQGADVVLAGGMGERAKDLLSQQGIEVVLGVPAETPEELVNRYLKGVLESGVNVCDH